MKGRDGTGRYRFWGFGSTKGCLLVLGAKIKTPILSRINETLFWKTKFKMKRYNMVHSKTRYSARFKFLDTTRVIFDIQFLFRMRFEKL